MDPTVELLRKVNKVISIEDPKVGKMEWLIRPIPAYDLLEHVDLFSDLPKENQFKGKTSDNLSPEDAKIIKEKLFPIMKIVLPACTVKPRVTIDKNDPDLTDGTAIHMRDLPFRVVMTLFNEIQSISGLDEKAEEIRKKLQAQNSASQ